MGEGERTDGFFVRNRSALSMGLAALVIAGTADLVAGFCMVSMEEYILLVPGMMVLIYAAIGMRGNMRMYSSMDTMQNPATRSAVPAMTRAASPMERADLLRTKNPSVLSSLTIAKPPQDM